jgi:hypothetical protein
VISYYRHDISKRFELLPISRHEFIVLDSIIKDNELSDYKYISDLSKSDMYSCYNYIVDRQGDIHELIPLDYSIQESIYIAVLSCISPKVNNLDKETVTSECQKGLYNLIIYILCRLSHEFNTILNSDSVILSCNRHNYYKTNRSQFLTLKRNITHGINECRYTKDYKNMFNFL